MAGGGNSGSRWTALPFLLLFVQTLSWVAGRGQPAAAPAEPRPAGARRAVAAASARVEAAQGAVEVRWTYVADGAGGYWLGVPVGVAVPPDLLAAPTRPNPQVITGVS